MSKIFKNMIPYWKSILVILVLLFVQAWCDLSLPSYTSDIIDVGIQNSGVEHVTPKRITEEEFQTAGFIMTDDEVDLWESLYTKKDGYYERNKASEKELDETDDTLTVALLMNYQMGAMEEDTFKQLMAQQTGQDASVFENMTIEQIGEMMHVELKSFQQEKEDDDGNKVKVTCVDVRPIFAAMLESGQMDKDTVLSMRDSMEKTLDTMGSSLVKSMGIAYAVSADKAAGLDVDLIQKTYLLTAGLKMVGMALLMGVVTVLVGLFASRVGAGIGRDLREKVFKRVVGFSNAEMDQFSTASLITRSTNDIQQIQMVSVMVLRMVAYAPILGIGGVLKVMKTGAGMEWIIVLAIIVILGYVMLLVSLAMPKFKLMQKLVDNINLVSREILTGLSVIRAFGREDKEEERFDGANKELTKTTLFTNRVMTFMMPGMMMIMNVLTVGIVWVGAHKIDVGTMQVGAMTAFITYAMMIVMSFLMLTMMSIMLPRAAVAAGRIDEVIQTESSIQDVKNPEQLEVHNGVVRFDHVNFRYPGAEEDVLHDIDFVAEPGKTTAIIGSTGCGKSTLVNLIPRLYDVTGGKITLDGKDIRNITMKDLRDEIGFVPQKGVLFSGTIASNLRFGKDDATDAEIEKAAAIAQATEFIEAKDDKYETAIAQGGTNVSGGQKLCDMSLEALNSRISYVAQDQYLFNTSLLENIRLGRLDATDEEVMEAAKKAQCMEFLEKLPQGIHSMAGDAGKMLSGGQRQRISLARAILKDAPIVVLDEATAYADPENEEKMEAAIAELVEGKTLVVIAHKLPAIMNADQICVMDHGKMVATGKHQELIQACPEYQKLWKAAQDSAEWKVSTAKEGR